MKKILISLFFLIVIASSSVAARPGSLDLTVAVPENLIIYYWDKAYIDLSSINSSLPQRSSLVDETGDQDLSNASNIQNYKAIIELHKFWGVSHLIHNENGGRLPIFLGDIFNNSIFGNIDKSTEILPITLSHSLDSQYLYNTIDSSGVIYMSGGFFTPTESIPLSENNVAINLFPSWRPVNGDLQFGLDLSHINNLKKYRAGDR